MQEELDGVDSYERKSKKLKKENLKMSMKKLTTVSIQEKIR